MFKFYCVLSLKSKNYCADSETAGSPGEKMCPSPLALGTVALLFRLCCFFFIFANVCKPVETFMNLGHSFTVNQYVFTDHL